MAKQRGTVKSSARGEEPPGALLNRSDVFAYWKIWAERRKSVLLKRGEWGAFPVRFNVEFNFTQSLPYLGCPKVFYTVTC